MVILKCGRTRAGRAGRRCSEKTSETTGRRVAALCRRHGTVCRLFTQEQAFTAVAVA